MNTSTMILTLILLSPYIYTLLYILSKFTQIDYFTLIGLFSLISLAISKYSSIILFSFTIVPSITCFGLLVSGYPLPLIGLATGFLMAFPLFTLLGALYENRSENIVLSYLIALILNISLLISSEVEKPSPTNFISTLISRVPRTILQGEGYTLTEYVNSIFTILTALSCLSLIFIIIKRIEPSFPKSLRDLNPLILSTLITLTLSLLTYFWVYSNFIVISSILIIMVYVIISLKMAK